MTPQLAGPAQRRQVPLTRLSLMSICLLFSPSCAWRPQAPSAPTARLTHSAQVTPLSEPARSPPSECEPSNGARALTFRYLADQLGDSLREREYCVSTPLPEAHEGVGPQAGRCQGAQRCGSAQVHAWLPSELGAHLALIDLAVRRSALQVQSMKTGYEDQQTISRSADVVQNPNQEVSQALSHQTLVGQQALHFTLGVQGRCLYRLKTFKELSRDELIYGGLKDLTRRFDAQGFTSARYLFERHQTSTQTVALLLVDVSSQGAEEEDLLQHQLLCKLPSGVSALSALEGVSVWAHSPDARGRLIELSAPIRSTPKSSAGPMRQLNDELIDRARSGSRPVVDRVEEGRLR